MLENVKKALRVVDDAFDDEIQNLIDACLANLLDLGIEASIDNPRIRGAIIAYCKWQFGFNEEKDVWEKTYKGIVGEMLTATGYTKW